MKILSFLLVILGCCPLVNMQAENVPVSQILNELDKMIAHKRMYHSEKEAKIKVLKERLKSTTDFREQYKLCGALFDEYLHYQTDSALYYVNEKLKIQEKLNKPELKCEITINRAEVMGIMGMYNEALIELQQLDPAEINEQILPYYYSTFRGYYGWIADYTANWDAKQKYLEKTQAYRDSILLLPSSNLDRDIADAEKSIFAGDASKALNLLGGDKYKGGEQNIKQQAYLYYTLSEAYELMKDTDRQIYYLAKTALLDMKMAVREYASLQKLARLIYDQGDLERAYRYLNCSMEDAVACNARLRFLEVTEYYPIIDKAYKAKEAQEQQTTLRMLLVVSFLAFILVVLAAYLYYWTKRLSVMRHHLYEANRKLISANQDLEETGKIKEVYIARYLDRCVGYLEKLEQYRRSLEKLAMASKMEELFKAIRSEQFLRDERKVFYTEFDKSFLDLFPNFVEDFNNLLAPEGRIYPKSGELLNTELRIFALIRLGVTDATRIAHFLGYSLATVYNYRSKVRNKALGDKEHFEEAVINL